MKKKKICIVIGTAMNLNSLYKDQFKFLMDHGFEVTGVSPPGIEHEWLQKDGVLTKEIHLRRKPAPLHDLFSLIQLSWYFCFNRFDIVSVSTPKAALIGSLAAFITFQKNIVYTQRGRAYENVTGKSRRLYEFFEWLICRVSTKVFCISHEIREDLVAKVICSAEKIFVIGAGSSNGVDLNKFTKNPELINQAKVIRNELKLNDEDVLLLNSGRLRKDKGINELVFAFMRLSEKYPHLHLMLQGEFEIFDPLDEEVTKEIANNSRIHVVEWKKDIQSYIYACDIFVFPSHREGFGNVAIEASALERPVISFNVVGCRESVNDGVSGLLCGDISSSNLETAIEKLVCDKSLRLSLGNNGREWVVNNFNSVFIWEELVKMYNSLIQERA